MQLYHKKTIIDYYETIKTFLYHFLLLFVLLCYYRCNDYG